MEPDPNADSRVGELARVLMSTGHAHHDAFIETDGFDPDWAIWYATHAVDRVNTLLSTVMSRRELVDELIGLSRSQPLEAPDSPWYEYYATRLADR